VSFLRLIEKITNGTSIVINETGTSVLVRPGTLPGGKYSHTCPPSRSIGYFLEAIVPLGVFSKIPLEVRFDGITGEEGRDMTVRISASFERKVSSLTVYA
jgi:RNA 3'-terminal phosphate cyclase-like protein